MEIKALNNAVPKVVLHASRRVDGFSLKDISSEVIGSFTSESSRDMRAIREGS
jgi:hypothetical protein